MSAHVQHRSPSFLGEAPHSAPAAVLLRENSEAIMLCKTSTWLTGRSEMGRIFPISTSTLAILTRVVTGLVIGTLIVVGLTNPSGGQTTKHVRAEQYVFLVAATGWRGHRHLRDACRTGMPERT